VLVATDERAEPHGAFTGGSAALTELVRGSPYFEYLVTDHEGSFGIFDTHHNALMLIGLAVADPPA